MSATMWKRNQVPFLKKDGLKVEDAWKKKNWIKKRKKGEAEVLLEMLDLLGCVPTCGKHLYKKAYHPPTEHPDSHSWWTCWRGRPSVFHTCIYSPLRALHDSFGETGPLDRVKLGNCHHSWSSHVSELTSIYTARAKGLCVLVVLDWKNLGVYVYMKSLLSISICVSLWGKSILAECQLIIIYVG